MGRRSPDAGPPAERLAERGRRKGLVARQMIAPLVPALLALAPLCGTGCASSGARPLEAGVVAVDVLPLDAVDPIGDTRLAHPTHAQVTTAHFDLERVTLAPSAEGWRLEATFAKPIPTLKEVRAARDRVVEIVPQTIDVYLDLGDGGHVDALPGRGFRFPSTEAWDRVLVATSMPDTSFDDAVYAKRVTAQGRRLVAVFPRDAIPASGVRGVLVVVLATAPEGEGRVRGVTSSGSDCQVWDEQRCQLIGEGSAIVDALSVDVIGQRPVAMLYPEGQRPRADGIPVVFSRAALLGAAPVDARDVAKGDLATVFDRAGVALGTAIVLDVVGDTASMEIVGKGALEAASSVVFVPKDKR